MPRKMSKKEMEGNGIKDIVKGLNKFLKKHKVISRGASIIEPVAGKHKSKVRKVGQVAKQLGYGKGSGLKLAGAGKKRRVGRPKKRGGRKKM